jgi:hypothetical protein
MEAWEKRYSISLNLFLMPGPTSNSSKSGSVWGGGRYQSLNRHESPDNVTVMHGIRHAGRGNGHNHEEPTVYTTLRWREMDSNFWYRDTKTVDFRTIQGIAGVSAGLLDDTT